MDKRSHNNINKAEYRYEEKMKWKKELKDKIKSNTNREIEEEIGNTNIYKNNIEDEVIPGEPKKYMYLCSKKADAWCRTRADMMDPTRP